MKESGEERKDFTKKKSPEGPKPLDLLKKSGSLHEFSGKNLKESGSLYTNALHMKKKKWYINLIHFKNNIAALQ